MMQGMRGLRGLPGMRGAALAVLIGVGVALALTGPAQGADGTGGGTVTVRAGHPRQVPFTLHRAGEGLLDADVSAPGVSWGSTDHTSAVVSVSVDGTYMTDVVIGSSTPAAREFFLGHLSAGRHTVTLTLATDRSQGGTAATLADLRTSEVSAGAPEYAVAAHAPILYGRTLLRYGGAFQNAWTDTPLIAWHQVTPLDTGGYQISYTIVWSNEDGGTGDAPAELMARWGRTTDIEWIYQTGLYRLDIDPSGNVIPGSEYFQSPNHGTTRFTGKYESGHPILQTCTNNNNVCDRLSLAARRHPMRFTLSAQQELAPDTAREIMMDRNPWTYWVTAQEMIREGKIEATPDPSTPALSDERDYLYLVLKKTTIADQNTEPWIGATVAVTLKGDDTVYRSDHSQAGWSIQRDDPAATTVELPPGTTADDIATISVLRVPGDGDNGGSIQVERIDRAMFLDDDYQPEPYFISDYQISGVTLTPADPQAVVWTAGSDGSA
jgi:hypothetical protein